MVNILWEEEKRQKKEISLQFNNSMLIKILKKNKIIIEMITVKVIIIIYL